MPSPMESTTERTKPGDFERRRREWASGCRKDARVKGSFSLVWRYEKEEGNNPVGEKETPPGIHHREDTEGKEKFTGSLRCEPQTARLFGPDDRRENGKTGERSAQGRKPRFSLAA